MINLKIKNNQNGRSMIEMLGVLAIIGVLSVGGIAGYSKAMMKYRINKTIEQITLIASNVRAFWGPQKNYDGVGCYCTGYECIGATLNDGCPIHKKAKIFPDEMLIIEDDKIKGIISPFSSSGSNGIRLTDKSSAETNKAFAIFYTIPDDDVCIELLSQDWTNANVAAIYIVDSNRETVYLKTPVTVDKAVKYCDYRYINEITFYFDIDVNAEPWKTRLK